MKEVPILFSTEMVKAILDGRKTQTRRIMKPQLSDSWMENTKQFSPNGSMFDRHGDSLFWLSDGTVHGEIKPKCKPGDLLWVRETWRKYYNNVDGYIDFSKEIIDFAADNPEPIYELDGDGFHVFNKDGSEKMIPWKPSIHMPKAAARIWLRVTDVRVERLNEISENDANAEGARFLKDLPLGPIGQRMITSEPNRWSMESPDNTDHCLNTAQMAFANIIEKVNGEGTWALNPWVFVYTFEVLSTTGKTENK